MNQVLIEQNAAMEEIVRNYGAQIKGAVYKSIGGEPCSEDILSEVYPSNSRFSGCFFDK